MNYNYKTGERSKLVHQNTKQKAVTAGLLTSLGHNERTVASLLGLSVNRINELLESKNLLTVKYED